MTIAIAQPQTANVPKPHRFSLVEYYRLVEKGAFDGKRVELIEGRIIDMPPQGNDHDIALGLTQRLLSKVFGDEFWIRPQMSINFKRSAPEPDIAVVKGSPQDYSQKPKTAILLIEISHSTLQYDQGPKASLYAGHGIADYWIINLVDRQLEVYRNPVADKKRSFGYRYSSVMTLKPGQKASPLALPRASIQVAAVLPPRL